MLPVEELSSRQYILNQQWAVRKMVQSHGSDKNLAYIHGFEAGIELLCDRVALSNSGIAEILRALARGMANENTEALRSVMSQQREIIFGVAFYRK